MHRLSCFTLLHLFVSIAHGQPSFVDFTGNVESDFKETFHDVVIVEDPGHQDVALPPSLSAMGLTVSGWDIKDIRFQFNPDRDALHIGINCFGICGDADGDGDPGRTSPALAAIMGVDLANFAGTECALVALDLGAVDGCNAPDRQMDVVVGYPIEQAAGSETFPCNLPTGSMDVRCFGVYLYAGTGYTDLYTRTLYSTASGALPHPAVDHNPSTSAARPDLEWTIEHFNRTKTKIVFFGTHGMVELRIKLGWWIVDGTKKWELEAMAYMGSFSDASIGADTFLPPVTRYAPVVFPCARTMMCADCAGTVNGPAVYDQCDVCGGDDSTCGDCSGVPNGAAAYDRCDVCNGDGSSCRDCRGVPNGAAVYDRCDVCNGDNTLCSDCWGVPNGPAVYDICNLCDGDGTLCLNCAGMPTDRYMARNEGLDACDICFGDNSRCADCRGVPSGPASYDQCDVCEGNGSSCMDCAGWPNGPAQYDFCDVCNGDGTSCIYHCGGIPNAPTNGLDACDVCEGDGTSCLDCSGEPNGPAEYDQCDVCGGDDSSCRDCLDVLNGPATYDECDVCDGDGSTCSNQACPRVDECDVCNGDGGSCVDCAGVVNGPTRYDECDVCGGDHSSCRDCLDVLNGPATYDECDVCDGDNTSCVDCAGQPNGSTLYDSCGECGGDDSSCAIQIVSGAKSLGPNQWACFCGIFLAFALQYK